MPARILTPGRKLALVAALSTLPQALLAGPAPATAGNPAYGQIRTIAGGGYTDGRQAAAVPLGFPLDVAMGPDGDIFVADQIDERIRRIDEDGVITTVAGSERRGYRGDGGPATDARLHDPSAVVVASDGTVYFADQGNHVVRRVDTSGTITTIAGTGEDGFSGDNGPATEAQLAWPWALALGPNEELYVLDANNSRVRMIDRNGIITTVAGDGASAYSGDDGPATQASLRYPGDIAVDAAGNLYIADSGNYRVRRVDPSGIITTVAGSGAYGFEGDGGPATVAKMTFIRGVAAAPDGSLYIADTVNDRIRRVAPNGIITTVAGNGKPEHSGDGGPATDAAVKDPHGITFSGGDLFIADLGNSRIRRVDAAGLIHTIAGTGECCWLGDGEVATKAALESPTASVTAPDGTIYIADSGKLRVRAIDPATGRIRTIAGTGEWGDTGDGGPATAAKLGDPVDLELDDEGNLYIAEFGSHKVRMVAPDGTISTVAGDGDFGYSGDGGPATAAGVSYPTGIDLDSEGNLYIASPGDHRIRRVDADTGIITTVAGNGLLRGHYADGIPAVLAFLDQPYDIAVDQDGGFYISELKNQRIRYVSPPDGPVPPPISTVAGNGTAGFAGDGGPSTAAQVANPTGLEIDQAGNLIFADTTNARIRRINVADGTIETIAGNGIHEFTGDGGPGSAASMWAPNGVSLHPAGLLIADTGNNRMRLLELV